MKMIEDMLNDGFEIKEISINNEVYSGKVIRFIDFFEDVWIEFIYDEIMFVPRNKIDWIKLKNTEENI